MAALLEDRDLQGIRQRFQQQAEGLLREDADADDKKKEKPLPRLNGHSVLWILAAVAVTYYVDFFPVLQLNLQEGCAWLLVGAVSLVVSLSIALFCIVYLEWKCGICDYDAEYPGLVPVAVVTFLVAAICFNVSLWPVWSFFTPVILFTQFMGFVMLVSLFG
ncbi:transmembrane protein 128 [Bufo gargarizans]|uniref:transmembrane protein 128 n=1 Tax=Bufo gargarizans TaxID=30331 RepID=UPI001CF3648A|nr:transmembrane protein 128 [Bufo gargarizans]